MEEKNLDELFPESIQNSPVIRLNRPVDFVDLSSNENAWDLTTVIKLGVWERLRKLEWNKYQDDNKLIDPLKIKLAKYSEITEDQLLLGPGASYLVSLVFELASRQGHRIIIPLPTFPYYPYLANLKNTNVGYWPLDAEVKYNQMHLPTISSSDIILIVSPNNPIGNVIELRLLLELLDKYPNNLFVIDEAYAPFSEQNYSYLTEEYNNLIIVRSFSKGMSGAAARLGYMIGNPKLLDGFRRMRAPFIFTPFCILTAEEILSNTRFVENNISKTKINRTLLVEELNELDPEFNFYRIFPAHGNFLFIKIHEETFYQYLISSFEKAQILLKKESVKNCNIDFPYCFRLTIGKPEHNAKVRELFKQAVLSFEKSRLERIVDRV